MERLMSTAADPPRLHWVGYGLGAAACFAVGGACLWIWPAGDPRGASRLVVAGIVLGGYLSVCSVLADHRLSAVVILGVLGLMAGFAMALLLAVATILHGGWLLVWGGMLVGFMGWSASQVAWTRFRAGLVEDDA